MQRQPSTAAALSISRAAALSISRKLSCSYIADDDNDRPVPVPGAWDRSLVDMEAGFSRDHCRPRWSFFNGYRVKGSPRYHEAEHEMTRREPHFLDSCFLCNKPLRNNDDLFMYRGDTPFCSEECRQEQIELDQHREMNLNLSSTVRTMRNKGQRHQQEQRSASPSKSPNPHLRKGTVAAA